jgi:hypothetical protein
VFSFSYFNCGGCVITEVLMIDVTLFGDGFFMLIYWNFKKNPVPESKRLQPSV